MTYKNLNPAYLPGWDDPTCANSKQFGEDWQRSRLSLLLLVPSLVARCERNILINPEHPDFHKITHSLAVPVWWDARLFGD